MHSTSRGQHIYFRMVLISLVFVRGLLNRMFSQCREQHTNIFANPNFPVILTRASMAETIG